MPPSFLPPKGAISVGMTLSLPASTRYQSSFRSDRTSASRVVIASEAKQSRAAQRSSVRDCFVAEPVLGSARDCFASLAMMRWTASAPRHRSASRRSCRNVHIEEAVHGRGWHDRIGYREAGVSGARCRRRRRDRLSPPIAAGRDRDVLRQAAALSGRAGGVRHGALPGPPDCRPRPSGALMPPSRVKPCVRWGRKNDQTGAQACCEAVSRPSMQFVPLKRVPEPVALMTHRARPLLVEQHTQLGNSIRAPMAERGIIARRRPAGFAALLAMIEHPEDRHLPAEVRPILAVLAQQWRRLGRQIAALERQIIAWHKSNPDNLRLATIQFGPICPAPWSPPRVSPSGLTAAGSSLPGSDWCRRRTRPAANSDAAASPKRAPAICASSWWSPLPASSPGCAPIPRSLPGSPGCSPGCRRARPPWRSPTRWPVAWARLAKQTTYRAPAAIETAHPA